MKEDTTNDTGPLTSLDHSFSGWSVWVEPCPNETKDIKCEMNHLTQLCGGMDTSPPFELHCTLLYNFKAPKECNTINEKEEYGNQMLLQCWELYQERMKRNNNNNDCCGDKEPNMTIVLNPTSFYYFHYPKEADGGKGFGCVISLLLLERTQELNCLQKAALHTFPPDERHDKQQQQQQQQQHQQQHIETTTSATNRQNPNLNQSKESQDTKPNMEEEEEEEEEEEKGGKFIPHMALIYAPEIYGDIVKTRTNELHIEKSNLLQPFRGHVLSLWSTEGKLNDWYLIARLSLT